ncbi:SUMF1/EgtB/PvdO family nonheme iron enzyme [Agrobacterium deltaense]|uniref:SUMF1/EgtB/PvdO family nonheme iron enzyme n=1 Tax=Agrobacterium deltaense TaxID=1183412 RepID=UPI003D990426
MGIPGNSHFPNVVSLLLPLSLATLLATAIGFQSGIIRSGADPRAAITAPQVVTVPAGHFTYRAEGEYFRNGYAVDGPMVDMTMRQNLTIMKYQVSSADYARCVAEGGCQQPEPGFAAPVGGAIPATGISQDDARAYAKWLSDRTGEVWRLPSDAELAFAAGSLFPDETLGVAADTENPALRWLADYERQTSRKASGNPVPQSYGSFGENEYGLADFGGNVWEWTSSCSRRVTLGKDGEVVDTVASCGIPVASGKHRAAMSAFVKNPKSGGCAVGVPPDNLGFRLVKDTRWYAPLLERLGAAALFS